MGQNNNLHQMLQHHAAVLHMLGVVDQEHCEIRPDAPRVPHFQCEGLVLVRQSLDPHC